MCEVPPGMKRRRLSESLHTQLRVTGTGRKTDRQSDIIADSTAAGILGKFLLSAARIKAVFCKIFMSSPLHEYIPPENKCS